MKKKKQMATKMRSKNDKKRIERKCTFLEKERRILKYHSELRRSFVRRRRRKEKSHSRDKKNKCRKRKEKVKPKVAE